MCTGPYNHSKKKLQVWMELAPEYSRKGYLPLVNIGQKHLIVVWLLAMYPRVGSEKKIEISHIKTH